MNRPTGVTLIAAFFFVCAGLLVLAAIGFFIGGAFVGSLLGTAAQQRGGGMTGAGIGAMIGAVVGVFMLIGSIFNLACGVGLWKMKEWGRILTIVLCAIGLALGALGLIAGMLHLHILMMMWRMVWLAIDAGIIWYLVQPEVRAAFARAQMPPQAFAAH